MRRVVIKGWTLEGGPRLGDYQSTISRRKLAIREETSPKAISLLLMWLLDEWLLECRFVYQLAVPAKRGEQYTLSELSAPFVKRLRATQSALGAPMPSLETLLEQLKDVPRVRNMRAAHENEFAREFPLATMRGALRPLPLPWFRLLYCFECDECAGPSPWSWRGHGAPPVPGWPHRLHEAWLLGNGVCRRSVRADLKRGGLSSPECLQNQGSILVDT